jgi:ABC-type oligopeptide transport system substrate-binding subunit
VILNRRTLLATLGLALPAAAAEAATATPHGKKKKPTHSTKTASAKPHKKSTHSSHQATPAQS